MGFSNKNTKSRWIQQPACVLAGWRFETMGDPTIWRWLSISHWPLHTSQTSKRKTQIQIHLEYKYIANSRNAQFMLGPLLKLPNRSLCVIEATQMLLVNIWLFRIPCHALLFYFSVRWLGWQQHLLSLFGLSKHSRAAPTTSRIQTLTDLQITRTMCNSPKNTCMHIKKHITQN